MRFTDAINQVINLTSKERTTIETKFTSQTLKKQELWVEEGKYCNHVAFINKGTLRIFYNDLEGNEISCFFMPEGNFVSSFTSFLVQTPTKENIQAMEEVELWVIHREDLISLSEEVPKIQIWRRVIAENLFILMERRISMLHSQSAQERYETMIKENGELLLKVPLQYIASFLGITPQHLSRLRRKLLK
ncbi:MAG: Crp/Fnr family transcriptional regulator [Aureispira sp.]